MEIEEWKRNERSVGVVCGVGGGWEAKTCSRGGKRAVRVRGCFAAQSCRGVFASIEK